MIALYLIFALCVILIIITIIPRAISKCHTDLQIKIITLPECADRRANIIKGMRGASFDFVEATDGRALTPDEEAKRDLYIQPNTLSPGQVGCFLSHLKIYEEIVARRTAMTLILEDDVHIDNCNEFFVLLQEFVDCDYDLLFLGHCSECDSGDVVKHVGLYEVRRAISPRCTHAYMISYNGAQKLLDFFKLEQWDLPIDELIYRADINKYSVMPSFISQYKDFNSTINR